MENNVLAKAVIDGWRSESSEADSRAQSVLQEMRDADIQGDPEYREFTARNGNKVTEVAIYEKE